MGFYTTKGDQVHTATDLFRSSNQQGIVRLTYVFNGKGPMVTIAGRLGRQDRSGPLFLNSGSVNRAYGARGPTQICKARRNIVLDPKSA